MGYCQVQFSIDDRDVALAIIEELLERRLVACGQILGPIESHYRWHGSLEQCSEWLVALKSTDALSEDVLGAVAELHPYEVPEILVLPILSGEARYFTWIDESVHGPDEVFENLPLKE